MEQNNQYFDLDSYQARNLSNGRPPKKDDSGAFFGGLAVGVMSTLIVLCVAVLIIWSVNKGVLFDRGDKGRQTTIQSVKGYGFVTDEMVKKIDKLVTDIRTMYYLDEVSDEELETGLYRGLMSSLGDPYTEYYTNEEYIQLMQGASGIYYGIGAVVSIDSETNLPKLGQIFKGSPAEKVGLRPNDLVYKVNGEATNGKSLSEVVSEIRGEEGTTVNITIIRDGNQLEVTPTRARLETPTVETKMLENGMGYLQITEFDDVTLKQFTNGMEELYADGMKGLILDLRGNPGGNLSTVVEIARNLLPQGLVVYTETKEGKRTDYKCKGDKEIQIPMVVLVDMNSASASEILAGAIQDYGKGTLVGTTTFGKGIVQTIYPDREDGTAIKITVSGYFTPKGRNIHKIGIEPDIVCEFDADLYYDEVNPIDNQLEKAKEVLAGLMNK